MRKAHFFDLDREWETFVNYLKSDRQPPRIPFMAPDVPEGFIQRPREFEQLITELVDEKHENLIATTTFLQGAGGYGKTTVAIALCHDDRAIRPKILLAAKTYGSVFLRQVAPLDSSGEVVGPVWNHVTMEEWGNARRQIQTPGGAETLLLSIYYRSALTEVFGWMWLARGYARSTNESRTLDFFDAIPNIHFPRPTPYESSCSEGASYRREDSLAMGSLRGQGVVMSNYGLLLRDHVTLRCHSIDRIFLQAYVPRLQAVGEVCTFLRWQRKVAIPSSAAFGKIGEEYVKAVHRFAEANGIPVVYFRKGQNKEEVAGPYLQAAARGGKERVVMIGIAQEKASVWRSWPRKGQEKARHPHMDWGREMAFINHFYSICGIWNGAPRSGRPTPMRPFQYGCGSTVMSGPSGN
jgi:hypothetical protein